MRKMVVVEWFDTVNGAGWAGFDAIADEQPALVQTVGFLVHKDKQRVALTTSVSDDEGLGFVVIPAAWVQSITEVRVAAKKD